MDQSFAPEPFTESSEGETETNTSVGADNTNEISSSQGSNRSFMGANEGGFGTNEGGRNPHDWQNRMPDNWFGYGALAVLAVALIVFGFSPLDKTKSMFPRFR